jgi:hypothetical protein
MNASNSGLFRWPNVGDIATTPDGKVGTVVQRACTMLRLEHADGTFSDLRPDRVGRKEYPAATVHAGDVGASLIVIATTGMMPGTKGRFKGTDGRSVLVVRESETEWSTYAGLSATADDRTWSNNLDMAHYIVRTVL